MQRAALKAWFLVHKWTSLVCTVFLLLLCLTGLPLIFAEEIDHLSHDDVALPATAPDAPHANVDTLIATALAQYPGDVPLFFGWDDDSPTVYVNTGARADTPPAQMHTAVLHEVTGTLIPTPQFNEGVMFFLYRLHTDLFAGLPGMLFLGAMALLFVVAIVSGAVLYAPFMRKLPFGTVRTGRGRRLVWLDLHNVLGAVTLAWALVVGLTGAINTLAGPLQRAWQTQQLADLSDRYATAPPPTRYASLDAAIRSARAAEPTMRPAFVSYPGTGYSGAHHYGVFMRGDSPLTARLYRPVLVDVQTGMVTARPQLPGYMTVLLLSQPLHFGDYGGLPLKLLWALLDVATIVVLVSGLVLWARRGSTGARIAEIERGGMASSASGVAS